MTLGLLTATLLFIGMWYTTYTQRVKVVDMAELYKPSLHGDEYKARCLMLYRDYKRSLWICLATTVVYIPVVWDFLERTNP